MYEASSLLLNEHAFKNCQPSRQPVFIYEWLRYLDKVLPVTQKDDIKRLQKQLVTQLQCRIESVQGFATRRLLARCVAKVYTFGDTYQVFDTISVCLDFLRAKDDSANSVASKLNSLACLGELYEAIGRSLSQSTEAFVQVLAKWLKTANALCRAEIMSTLSKVVKGLGSGSYSSMKLMYKDIYKMAKTNVNDTNPGVRVAAVKCLAALATIYPICWSHSEVDAVLTLCVKAMSGSNNELRTEIAKYLGLLFATACDPPLDVATLNPKTGGGGHAKPFTFEDVLYKMSSPFLRGGVGGLLKVSNKVGGSKEVRVGLALTYVEFLHQKGPAWIEKNIVYVFRHFLELASEAGTIAYSSVVQQMNEAITIRNCISYILRNSVGSLLSEQAQVSACKQLGIIIAEYVSAFEIPSELGSESILMGEHYPSAFSVTAAMLELSALVGQIGTAATPLFEEANGIMEPIFACLLHPIMCARVSTAWCLRSVALAAPSLLSPLIDRCINRLEHMNSYSDAISGYSMALAALISVSTECQLGVPSDKPKQVFAVAKDLLKTASQQSRLALVKTQCGWLLLQALVPLDPSFMREFIPKYLQLWRAAFPRSAKEAEAEKNRGDHFTWQMVLESRAGALATMATVLARREFADTQTLSAVKVPLECAMVLMSQLMSIFRTYGAGLRNSCTSFRIKLYRLIQVLPPAAIQHIINPVMSECVADIILYDDNLSCQMSSAGTSLCSGPELVLLNPLERLSDRSYLEDSISKVYAVEKDSAHSYLNATAIENDMSLVMLSQFTGWWPESDGVHLVCLDNAIFCYWKVFPLMPTKNKLQTVVYFGDNIKQARTMTDRQKAILFNVICAISGAYRTVNEARVKTVDENIKKAVLQILLAGISTSGNSKSSTQIRCVASDAIGRFVQAVGDPSYVANVAQYCFDHIKTAQEESFRAGYALVLGSLHRHVGSLGSGQHLNTGVSIVLALAQDNNQIIAQAWSLVSLSLIAETGSGMFRGYVEPILSVCLKQLLRAQEADVLLVQSVGKLLSALMTCVGPDLAIDETIENIRASLLAACTMQFNFGDALVKAEALSQLQQMHLYAPRHVQLNYLVCDIATVLCNVDLCVRKAAVCCLRQLVQQEAREVREHAQILVPQGVVDEGKKLPLPDTGLEGALLAMLDIETDKTLRIHIEETLISLVVATSSELMGNWLQLCMEILATSNPNDNTRSTLVVDDGGEKNDADADDDADLNLQGVNLPSEQRKVQPRWPTRVFVIEIVRRLMSVCDTERAHLDLMLANELNTASHGHLDFLVLHLSDLIRMSFIAAVSDITDLRYAGLKLLQEILRRFAHVKEPDSPGHMLLEQFQAQVSAALRPAFAPDTPSHVTAAACEACSSWIAKGVAKDLNDLQRVHKLLVSSLKKLRDASINSELYSEAAATQETLAILRAWAEVYVTAVKQEKEKPKNEIYYDDEGDGIEAPSQTLLSLVQCNLDVLLGYWLAAVHDHSCLWMWKKYQHMSLSSGAFYKVQCKEASKEFYRACWPPIVEALSTWLYESEFDEDKIEDPLGVWPNNNFSDRYSVLLGVVMGCICSRSHPSDEQIEICLRSLSNLLSCRWFTKYFECGKNVQRVVHILNALYRVVLSRIDPLIHFEAFRCANAIIEVVYVGNESLSEPPPYLQTIETGSLLHAVLEFVQCVLSCELSIVKGSQSTVKVIQWSIVPCLFGCKVITVQKVLEMAMKLPVLTSPILRINVVAIVARWFLLVLKGLVSAGPLAATSASHLNQLQLIIIKGFRTFAASPVPEEKGEDYDAVLYSIMHALVFLAKDPDLYKSDGNRKVDKILILYAIEAYIGGSQLPIKFVRSRDVFNGLIELLRSQIHDSSREIRVHALCLTCRFMSLPELYDPVRSSLGKDLAEIINNFAGPDTSYIKTMTDDMLPEIEAILKVVKVTVDSVESTKKLRNLSLYVELLIRMISAITADEWRQLTPAARKLHEHIMTCFGSLTREDGKLLATVLDIEPSLKCKLTKFYSLLQSRHESVQNAKSTREITEQRRQPLITLRQF